MPLTAGSKPGPYEILAGQGVHYPHLRNLESLRGDPPFEALVGPRG